MYWELHIWMFFISQANTDILFQTLMSFLDCRTNCFCLIIRIFIICVCCVSRGRYVGERMMHTYLVHVWKSKDKFKEPTLSLYNGFWEAMLHVFAQKWLDLRRFRNVCLYQSIHRNQEGEKGQWGKSSMAWNVCGVKKERGIMEKEVKW